jgi:hypothetical protein
MQIKKLVVNSSGAPTEVEITYEKGDKFLSKKIEDDVVLKVKVAKLPTTNSFTYVGHSVDILTGGAYVPAITTKFTIPNMLKVAYQTLANEPTYASWFPALQDEIEEYIKYNIKSSKTGGYSFRGDVAKAVFVAVYLYGISQVPSFYADRLKWIQEKLRISEGVFTKNLSRVSAPLEDVISYYKAKNINVFTDTRPVEIKTKSYHQNVFLMRNSNPAIKGGYMTQHTKTLIEDYITNTKYSAIKDSYRFQLMLECSHAVVDTTGLDDNNLKQYEDAVHESFTITLPKETIKKLK